MLVTVHTNATTDASFAAACAPSQTHVVTCVDGDRAALAALSAIQAKCLRSGAGGVVGLAIRESPFNPTVATTLLPPTH